MPLGCSGFVRWRAMFSFVGPSLYGKARGRVCSVLSQDVVST
jgi:hypothetical protein